MKGESGLGRAARLKREELAVKKEGVNVVHRTVCHLATTHLYSGEG